MSLVEEGYYSNLLEPLLDVYLLGPQGGRVPFPALIDTGCNGTLMIFETERRRANLPETKDRSTGAIHTAHGPPLYGYYTQGLFKWFGAPTEVDIIVLPVERNRQDVCVIGMELLVGKRIILDEHDFRIEGD